MERIAIVELGGSHDECILSQLIALKSSNCHVTLVCTKNLYDRTPFFMDHLDDVQFIHLSGSAFGDFYEMVKLNRFFTKTGISKVVLNTAQGGHIRNLCLTSNKNVEFIGIIHTLKKFQGSFTQKLIDRKIKKYFVLNDFFLEKIQPKKGQSVQSFYPLRFPKFRQQQFKPDHEVWITIIGGVETRRKDLLGSLSLMKGTKEYIRFVFLGKSQVNSPDRLLFEQEMDGAQLAGRVTLFDEFVSAEEFDAVLEATDIIWPMVHPGTPSADEYFKNQISGAINVAFSYKIPLLVHRQYAASWKDLNNSIQYEMDTFNQDLDSALVNLQSFKNCLIEEEKFDPEVQEKKYLAFLFGH